MSAPSVNLYWEISVKDGGSLRDVALPPVCEGLDKISDLFVCLLYFGGRSAEKAAKKNGLSTTQFVDIDSKLSQRNEEVIEFFVHSIHVHKEVVVAKVELPTGLPYCPGIDNCPPHITYRIQPDASKNVARSALVQPTGVTLIELSPPLQLKGTIQLKTARPRSNQIHREKRKITSEGQLVHVRKLENQYCAKIVLPHQDVCELVLKECSREKPQICGFFLKVKKDRDRKGAHLFAWWDGKASSGQQSISVEELQDFFDQKTRPHMLLEPRQIAIAMLAGDVVLLLKLSRKGGSEEIQSMLCDSHCLANCRERMQEASQDIMPHWASGATIFVPFGQDYLGGLDLKPFNIVAYRSDKAFIQQALEEKFPTYRSRPRLHEVQTLSPTNPI